VVPFVLEVDGEELPVMAGNAANTPVGVEDVRSGEVHGKIAVAVQRIREGHGRIGEPRPIQQPADGALAAKGCRQGRDEERTQGGVVPMLQQHGLECVSQFSVEA